MLERGPVGDGEAEMAPRALDTSGGQWMTAAPDKIAKAVPRVAACLDWRILGRFLGQEGRFRVEPWSCPSANSLVPRTFILVNRGLFPFVPHGGLVGVWCPLLAAVRPFVELDVF